MVPLLQAASALAARDRDVGGGGDCDALFRRVAWSAWGSGVRLLIIGADCREMGPIELPSPPALL